MKKKSPLSRTKFQMKRHEAKETPSMEKRESKAYQAKERKLGVERHRGGRKR